jgi:hypothetical protein
MAKIWTLLLILAISTFFIHVPHEGSVGFILNPEVKLSYNQYAWMICEHLIMIALAAIILDESTDHKNLLMVFLWIQIIDLLAFVLAYTDPLKNYVITFNILKLAIFIAAIVIDRWKPWKRELSALN